MSSNRFVDIERKLRQHSTVKNKTYFNKNLLPTDVLYD